MGGRALPHHPVDAERRHSGSRVGARCRGRGALEPARADDARRHDHRREGEGAAARSGRDDGDGQGWPRPDDGGDAPRSDPDHRPLPAAPRSPGAAGEVPGAHHLPEGGADRLGAGPAGNGELDAALIALPCETGDLAVEDIFEDEFLFACNRAHALAGAEEVSREALEGEQLMLLEEGHCLRGHALDVCGTGDTRARAQFEASSLHTLVQMVAAGIGVTLVPRIAVEAQITRGTEISLARLTMPSSRRIGLAWRQTSLRAEEFRLLASTLRELTEMA